MKLGLTICLVVLIVLLMNVIGCTSSQTEESLLFVQVATEGSLSKLGDAEDTYLLMLSGVGRSTIWFTDRPGREAGHIPTGQLIDN
ncbi:hypothetical protein ACFLU4_06765 [Chloroflexota bacterium]